MRRNTTSTYGKKFSLPFLTKRPSKIGDLSIPQMKKFVEFCDKKLCKEAALFVIAIGKETDNYIVSTFIQPDSIYEINISRKMKSTIINSYKSNSAIDFLPAKMEMELILVDVFDEFLLQEKLRKNSMTW